jgi:hypothetical protein
MANTDLPQLHPRKVRHMARQRIEERREARSGEGVDTMSAQDRKGTVPQRPEMTPARNRPISHRLARRETQTGFPRRLPERLLRATRGCE